MFHARLALAAVVLGSLAMTGCQTVGSHSGGGFASNQPAFAPASQMNSGIASQSPDGYPVQQVAYHEGSGCGCTSCASSGGCASNGQGACGCGSANCRGGGLLGGGNSCNVCNCGKFSNSVFGSNKCWRCGLLRGGQCGSCGRFGLFNGRCHGCGGHSNTPHTPAFAGPQGPLTGTYAYPYYTTRGPRDFLMSNPPSLGR